MKYAVIQTGGKQYKVQEGDIVDLERLPTESGSVSFDKVLLYSDGGKILVGTPFVDGVLVSGVVDSHTRGEKIRVAKYKAKVRYRRVAGHRQSLTRVTIDAINVLKKPATTSEKPASKPRITRTRKSEIANA